MVSLEKHGVVELACAFPSIVYRAQQLLLPDLFCLNGEVFNIYGK